VKITFTSAGKAYLESHAGAKATITTVFKPTKGKSSTSTTTVTIG
jgi:hypothetical protein